MNVKYHTRDITLTAITTDEPLVDVPCGACTLCCQRLTPYLTPDEIESGQYPISLLQPTEDELTNLHIGPKVVLHRYIEGGCAMLIDGTCSIYEHRPIACRQFDCRKNHNPTIPDMTL